MAWSGVVMAERVKVAQDRAGRLVRQIEALRPGDEEELHRFVKVVLGVDVTRKAVVAGHSSPFEYLVAAFFEPPPEPPPEVPPEGLGKTFNARSLTVAARCGTAPEPPEPPEVSPEVPKGLMCPGGLGPTNDGPTHLNAWGSPGSGGPHSGPYGKGDFGGDLVVWANRGGGKTFLGAVATALDLIFKPGVQVRILAGSVEQAGKMYGYLLKLLDRPGVRGLVEGQATQRRVGLINGSCAEVLAASQHSVRGVRVHKLRCDEVELFDADIWEAAQRVTQSGWCGGVYVRGRVEAMSTMHRPFGLMSRLVGRGAGAGVGVFKWGVLDVVERCLPPGTPGTPGSGQGMRGRDCGTCALWEDCGGLARGAAGFVAIDDVIVQKGRSSREAWESEMMCERPRRSDCVYPGFAVGDCSIKKARGDGGVEREVRTADPTGINGVRPTDSIRGLPDGGTGAGHVGGVEVKEGDLVVGGIDFGWRSPFVMVWARVVPGVAGVAGGGQGDVVEVFDEYVETGRTLEEHIGAIKGRGWPRPAWVGVDPAGAGANSQTGLSDVGVLRRAGYVVRHAREGVRGGIERVRRRLDQGKLRIDGRRCGGLVGAMSTYHFDAERPWCEEPVKDGPDHLCDALRYLVVNLEVGAGGKVVVKRWW